MADAHISFADYAELLDTVSGLCVNGRTGSLFIISDTNCFARIVVAGGNIIYLEYRLKKGVEAIPLFREIRHGTLDFKDGKVISHKASPLPPTADLLAQLGGAMPAKEPTQPASGNAGVQSHADVYKAIEDELLDILGPMASLIWEEHLEQAGGADADIDLAQLIDSVSTEIDDPQKAMDFRNHVRSLIT